MLHGCTFIAIAILSYICFHLTLKNSVFDLINVQLLHAFVVPHAFFSCCIVFSIDSATRFSVVLILWFLNQMTYDPSIIFACLQLDEMRHVTNMLQMKADDVTK